MRLPCIHLGKVDRRGESCSKRWVYRCEKHGGVCSTQQRIGGARFCLGCEDYEADTPGQPEPLPTLEVREQNACECTAPGYCVRHGMHKGQKAFELCRIDPVAADLAIRQREIILRHQAGG